ncbi:response regulator [Croceimicrobium hydrocarbonivorans]|uniref:Response regulator n=1 Tax=Croceimicrobium hydrocarbonivorans TaxID=2761580 RepID=A0A7H0VGP3_9FLAO|nr:response regulator [Croceimicrobium hydrocarbonivorans]QNR24891.1 response regulator [Croceimicrobium hydrocarbonivorans]
MNKTNAVFIIDDDPIYQFSFGAILKLINPEVQTSIFSNGEEALDHCKSVVNTGKSCPKLIFLDLNMPVMDGWNFLDELVLFNKDVLNKTKVYIVSSSVHEEDTERAKNYPLIQGYLVKPVKRDVLQSILNEALSKAS